MAGKYLGDEFDIHGGGLDLRFPHHENELAQSTGPGRQFAPYWMHNAWVTAAGEKMSKSLGNGALVSEVTRRYPPRAVRFYLAQPHYRWAIEFADDSLAEATTALARIDNFVSGPPSGPGAASPVVPAAFAAAMNDDLGTPAAVAVLYTGSARATPPSPTGTPDGRARPSPRSRGCSACSGSTADDPVWGLGPRTTGSTGVVDGLVARCSSSAPPARAQPRLRRRRRHPRPARPTRRRDHRHPAGRRGR